MPHIQILIYLYLIYLYYLYKRINVITLQDGWTKVTFFYLTRKGKCSVSVAETLLKLYFPL